MNYSKEKQTKNKGITLIALVITIIVLLILSGVSITMLTGQNGILTQTLKAKEETKIADEKEKLKLAVLGTKLEEGYEEKINEEYLETELNNYIGKRGQDYELIGDCPFVVEYKNSGRSYFIDEIGNIKEYVDISKYVNVGDYVDYNPTILNKSGTSVESSKLKYVSYTGTTTESGNGYISSEGGGGQTYTATSDIKWKIFDVENGIIQLISETPIYKTSGSESFIMNGARGYLYAEAELSKICSIYGYGYGANTNLDTVFKYGGPFDEQEGKIKNTGARSITIEDINKKAGISVSDLNLLDSNYGKTINLKEKVFYPTINTNRGDIITGKSNLAELEEIVYTAYKYNKSKILDEETQNLLFNGDYWLASRCLNDSKNEINIYTNYFNVRVISGNNIDACNLCFGTNSNLNENTYYVYAIRPIVTLKYDVIDTSTNYEEEGHWNLK